MSHLHSSPKSPAWHQELLGRLGTIRSRAAFAYRHLPASEQQEAIADVTADVTLEFARLSARRRTHGGLISPLLTFAIRHRAAGRRVGTPTNCRDAMSPVPRTGCRVVSLHSTNSPSGSVWLDVLPDSSDADPAEIACTRIDFETWLGGLSARMRFVVERLAIGERPGEIARELGITPGRLSQLRGELWKHWADFNGDATPAAA